MDAKSFSDLCYNSTDYIEPLQIALDFAFVPAMLPWLKLPAFNPYKGNLKFWMCICFTSGPLLNWPGIIKNTSGPGKICMLLHQILKEIHC